MAAQCLLVKNINYKFLKKPILATSLSPTQKTELRTAINSLCKKFWKREFGVGSEGSNDRLAFDGLMDYQLIIQSGPEKPFVSPFRIFAIEIGHPGSDSESWREMTESDQFIVTLEAKGHWIAPKKNWIYARDLES